MAYQKLISCYSNLYECIFFIKLKLVFQPLRFEILSHRSETLSRDAKTQY